MAGVMTLLSVVLTLVHSTYWLSLDYRDLK